MNRAVFLDRDGTVSEEVGYVSHVDSFRVYPWSAEAIRRLNWAGLRAVVVTNQSGVARGYFREEMVHRIHDKLARELVLGNARLDGIFYCPHHPEGSVPSYRLDCECRKPKPGMLLRAARKLQLDLAGSFVIGDRYLDLEMGFRAGAGGILVLTGYGKEEYLTRRAGWPRQPDHVAEDLLQAVDWLIGQVLR